MSDPVSKQEIEDVLASIRRLVASDPRPAADRGGAPLSEGQRLVLSPAHRVDGHDEGRGETPTTPPTAIGDSAAPTTSGDGGGRQRGMAGSGLLSGSLPTEDLDAEGQDSDGPDDGAVRAALHAVGTAAPDAGRAGEQGSDAGAAAVGPADEGAWGEGIGHEGLEHEDAASEDTGKGNDGGSLSDRIAGLEAIISARDDEDWDSEDIATQPGGSGLSDLLNRGVVDEAAAPAEFDGDATGVIAKDASADTGIVQDSRERETSVPGDVPDGADADTGLAADPDLAKAIFARSGTGSAGTSDETPRPDETAVLDEAALREIVAEIVRAELQGRLGERITSNVRKLVRREVHRILAERDFG